jgi:hypothetical protein
MDYLVIIIVIGIIVLVYSNRSSIFNIISPKLSPDHQAKFHDAELVKVILNLDEKSLEELFRLYKEKFGAGAARYARKTFQKWKTGKVRPNNQTFRRFLVHLPKVMSYDLKCEILRRLMEEYCSKNDYQISVYTDDWEETLTPLVEKIIEKPFNAELPAPIGRKLQWLSDGEMLTAQNILKKSQVEESEIAVSMLHDEFANIEKLLVATKVKPKVTHQLKFPYGTITLNIQRR